MSERATTYLLPCSCGQQILVEPRQAGETVRCACGQTRAAPTMREILDLPPAPDIVSAQAKSSWGNPQRLFVAGMVVFLLSATALAILYCQLPSSFPRVQSPEAERQRVQKLSILESMRYFHQYILPGIEIAQPAWVQSKRNMSYLGVAALGSLAAVGLVLTGLGIAGIFRRR